MGFGRDKVNGSYKVVRMFFDPNLCEILDVNIGVWRKLSPPPYEVHVGQRSACVNGSIYWFDIAGCKILAFDLHTEEFHDIPHPTPFSFNHVTQIVNLEDRVALVTSRVGFDDSEWAIEIWTLNEEEETWSPSYTISLADLAMKPWEQRWVTPVKVSKQGDFLIYDNKKNMLYNFCPRSSTLRQIFPHNCIVLSPYLETLFPLHTDQVGSSKTQSSCLGRKTFIFKVYFTRYSSAALRHLTLLMINFILF